MHDNVVLYCLPIFRLPYLLWVEYMTMLFYIVCQSLGFHIYCELNTWQCCFISSANLPASIFIVSWIHDNVVLYRLPIFRLPYLLWVECMTMLFYIVCQSSGFHIYCELNTWQCCFISSANLSASIFIVSWMHDNVVLYRLPIFRLPYLLWVEYMTMLFYIVCQSLGFHIYCELNTWQCCFISSANLLASIFIVSWIHDNVVLYRLPIFRLPYLLWVECMTMLFYIVCQSLGFHIYCELNTWQCCFISSANL